MNLSGLEPSIKFNNDEISGTELLFNVFALGFQTHKIRLIYKGFGKRFHKELPKIAIVLSELKKRNLFYVDSRTTSRSVALRIGKKIGVPATKKGVFLDHDLSEKAIRFQMERLMGMARYSGTVVGIGHPHWQKLRVLDEYSQQLKTDFEVVKVSQLVK